LSTFILLKRTFIRQLCQPKEESGHHCVDHNIT